MQKETEKQNSLNRIAFLVKCVIDLCSTYVIMISEAGAAYDTKENCL